MAFPKQLRSSPGLNRINHRDVLLSKVLVMHSTNQAIKPIHIGMEGNEEEVVAVGVEHRSAVTISKYVHKFQTWEDSVLQAFGRAVSTEVRDL